MLNPSLLATIRRIMAERSIFALVVTPEDDTVDIDTIFVLH